MLGQTLYHCLSNWERIVRRASIQRVRTSLGVNVDDLEGQGQLGWDYNEELHGYEDSMDEPNDPFTIEKVLQEVSPARRQSKKWLCAYNKS
jgi:hypothetical protein